MEPLRAIEGSEQSMYFENFEKVLNLPRPEVGAVSDGHVLVSVTEPVEPRSPGSSLDSTFPSFS